MIVKALLMFLLLFQDSKAGNDSISFEQSCLSDGGELLDRWKRICIPREYLGILLVNPETKDNKTSIDVEVSKLQIIKIGDDTITISMGILMGWLENRLKMNTQGVTRQVISLSEEDKKQIWSPQIVIENNMVSVSKEGEQFVLMKLGTWSLAYKKFYLSTTVRCEMDSQTFPFDKHVCKIEVSFNDKACSLIMYFFILN